MNISEGFLNAVHSREPVSRETVLQITITRQS